MRNTVFFTAMLVVSLSVFCVYAEDQNLTWETWKPGDRGKASGMMVISSVLDDLNVLVTPLEFRPDDPSRAKALMEVGVTDVQGLLKIYSEVHDKQFLIRNVPTYGYLVGHLCAFEGDVIVSKTSDS